MNAPATISPRLAQKPLPLSTIMVVGRAPAQHVLDRVAEEPGFDVVLIEPIQTAYSRIKQLAPTLVVMYFDGDDVAACQVLSMLKMDRATAGIPVVTFLLEAVSAHSDV
jgi:DNA-binding response OmpR family regulator